MIEHPIIFSTPMVQAIMAGMKTITRRIVDPQPQSVFDGERWETATPYGQYSWPKNSRLDSPDFIAEASPYGCPGYLLWVRETFSTVGLPEGQCVYKANVENPEQFKGWKPSIHMPKKFARIWLKIESLWTEQLHSISEQDILKEGVRIPTSEEKGSVLFKLGEENSALHFMPKGWQLDGKGIQATKFDFLFAHWAELWCSINGRESWDANPWVWRIKFSVLSEEERIIFRYPDYLLGNQHTQKAIAKLLK